jgi:hypothetical protein
MDQFFAVTSAAMADGTPVPRKDPFRFGKFRPNHQFIQKPGMASSGNWFAPTCEEEY